MRRVSIAIRVVAVVVVFTVSAIGQQASSVDLPIEPARMVTVMTLGDAARHNDFPAFDAMFATSSKQEAAAYAELHSFWKWSLTDPIGAFYGDEQHAKFAAEYPDYAEYIADFGIIDSHGRAFYPSAETRAFLLRKAELGRTAVVADGARASRPHLTAVPAVKEAPKKVTRPVIKVVERPAPVVVVIPRPMVATVSARDARPLRPGRPLSDARLGRGLLLIIAGLVALGMLSLIFSAPGEEEPAEQQQQPLEPMRIIPLEEKPKKTA